MELVEYISCSAYEMDDILYDCFPDNIVAARVSDADGLVYFVDADTNEMIDTAQVIPLIEKYINRQLYKDVNIIDISYNSAEDFLLIIQREQF